MYAFNVSRKITLGKIINEKDNFLARKKVGKFCI